MSTRDNPEDRFEDLWNHWTGIGEVVPLKLDAKPGFGFARQIDRWRVIAGVFIGPRGGVSEWVAIYDTVELVRLHRVRVFGVVPSDEMWRMIDVFTLRDDIRATGLKGAEKRQRGLELAQLAAECALQDIDARIPVWADVIQRLVDSISPSVYAYTGGLPGQDRRTH